MCRCMSIYNSCFCLALSVKFFIMATENPRILLTVSEDLLARIDDYRFGNRIANRSEAIRLLLEAGLKTKSQKKEMK